jgi:hypothetical protein
MSIIQLVRLIEIEQKTHVFVSSRPSSPGPLKFLSYNDGQSDRLAGGKARTAHPYGSQTVPLLMDASLQDPLIQK